MNTFWSVLVLILIIAAVALFLLYRQGQKLQARQLESQKLLDAYSQVTTMLIIDKKKMKLKEAPFPKEVFEQTPVYMRWMSVYVVKAKIGPRLFNLMCEKPVFEQIQPKTTIQAKISGAYITEVIKGAVLDEKALEKRKKEKAKAAKKAEKEAKKS
ncbi:MAG: hypothetical protein IIY96_02575 [Lachnospiraceae bacterium]|jgi:membrane-associated HD superfamily phosphohydrolase|nr:hypothetical protein [Lachnospiraceae bacterium]MBQ2041217.1 hypothetical protein [Lachnospiraceae bacterium]